VSAVEGSDIGTWGDRQQKACDAYMEKIIQCPRCGKKGPRYEIEGHSCADPEEAA